MEVRPKSKKKNKNERQEEQAESSAVRVYDLKIGEHWISDALSTVSILSFFVVPLNFFQLPLAY